MVTQILAKLLSLKNKKKPKIWYLILLQSQSILYNFKHCWKILWEYPAAKVFACTRRIAAIPGTAAFVTRSKAANFPATGKVWDSFELQVGGSAGLLKITASGKFFYLCMQYAAKVRKYKVLEFLVNGNQIQYTAVGKIVKKCFFRSRFLKSQNMA